MIAGFLFLLCFVTPKMGLVVVSASHILLTRRLGVHNVGCHCHGVFVFLPIDKCAAFLSTIHLLQIIGTFMIGLDGSSDCHFSSQQPIGQFNGGVELIKWYIMVFHIDLISQTWDKVLYRGGFKEGRGRNHFEESLWRTTI